MELGIAKRYEFYFPTLDGWFEQRVYPTPSGISQFTVDITERKRKERERDELFEALRESRAKLQAALESMSDAVFISDTEGNFIDFNEAFASFHRFPSKTERGKEALAEYPEFLEVCLPDGTAAPLEQWAVPRALRGETATEQEYTLRRIDTTYGYTRDELLAMTVADLRAAGTRAEMPSQMAEADERGILFESSHRRRDGSVFPVEVIRRSCCARQTNCSAPPRCRPPS